MSVGSVIRLLSREDVKQVVKLDVSKLLPLDPLPDEPPIEEPPAKLAELYDFSLDGHVGVGIPKPKTEEEKRKLVQGFLEGLRKLITRSDNWTFLQPLLLTLEFCAKCQACAEACPIYLASGRQEVYKPIVRAEVLRRIYKRYFTRPGRLFGKFASGDVEVNWTLVYRLVELAYRCTLCRRCAQACPMSVDNGLISREIRKIASQELGYAPKELHEKGTVQHLKVGSSTGMTPKGLLKTVKFLEEYIREKTGKSIKIPVDEKGADILLVHNAGEFLSWPENPAAFAIIFEEAGISWTMSSEPVGYDAVNYGVWYDDVQLARVALRHVEVARKLEVKKIVVGECGHATKALIVVADRVLPKELNIPRESALPLLAEIVEKKKLNLDPTRNNFPVTLHDPCNVVRLSGIVEPQRRVLRAIAPQLREMEPHGVYNYCCGGGSGFAIMHSYNFDQWRNKVSARMKVRQILNAFRDVLDPSRYPFKYVCAPCSNCKGAIRDAIRHYGLWERYRINYGGLVELVVNAMADLPKPYIDYSEFH
jgi:Fe-S oxidoreductase